MKYDIMKKIIFRPVDSNFVIFGPKREFVAFMINFFLILVEK